MREVRHHFDILRRRMSRREKEIASHVKSLTSAKVMMLHKQCRYVELMLHQENNITAHYCKLYSLSMSETYKAI